MKNMENHYTGNYKILFRKMQESLKNGEQYHIYTLEDSVFSISVFLKLVYTFNVIPVKLCVSINWQTFENLYRKKDLECQCYLKK